MGSHSVTAEADCAPSLSSNCMSGRGQGCMAPLRPGRAKQLGYDGRHALHHMHTGNVNPNRAAPPPPHRVRLESTSVKSHSHTGCEQQASPSIGIWECAAVLEGLNDVTSRSARMEQRETYAMEQGGAHIKRGRQSGAARCRTPPLRVSRPLCELVRCQGAQEDINRKTWY